MTTNFDIHAEITNRIVAAIEKGAGAFEMPWQGAATTMAPANAATKRFYRGINVLSLWVSAQAQGFSSPQWATFRQWQDFGAQVRKGEKGTPIVFYKTIEVEADEGDAADEKTVPFARASWVFNAAQVDGFEPAPEPVRVVSQFDKLEQVDAAIRATGARIDHGGNRAFYHRVEDRIQVPNTADFVGTKTSTAQESFYSTLLHELAHWTGAEHRLDREKGKRFADKVYAFEEIIAELSAAFSCARLGIAATPRADHAAYIADYLTILKSDKKAIFAAASAASAATNFILAFSAADREEAA
jgi:antirestriction protein ArdC